MSDLYPLPPDGEGATEDAAIAVRAWMDLAEELREAAVQRMMLLSNEVARAEKLVAALGFYANWNAYDSTGRHEVIVDNGDRARLALADYRGDFVE